jgi:hypothetical protein
MFKTALGRIWQRLVILGVLVTCLSMTATAPEAQAAAGCYTIYVNQCYTFGGTYNFQYCVCSYPQDVQACEADGGRWDYETGICTE